MSPENLTDRNVEDVKQMEQEDFRVALLYDLEQMAWWFKWTNIINTVLMTIISFIGMGLLYAIRSSILK